MAIQGFFTGDVKIRDLNGVLKAVDGIVEVATDAGTVTSVGLTVGSTGTDVNVANSPITSSGSITLNLPTASATNRGLLSSSDWASFNSKQGTITLTTTGNNGSATLVSGTLNIPTYTLAGLGGISLTSLSASSPLLYNNTTGAFSIQVANGSQSGYLSSSDWTAFNSKQAALTFSSPLVNTAGTISIPAATSSVNGYLTSTDWSTFNNKQATITLTTTGSSGAATLIGATLNIPNYTGGLSGYVPYTGATTNVDLGEYELKAGQLTLDTSPTGTAAVATTRWNNTIGSSETTLKGGTVILKNGVDLVARVVNKVTPNTTLTKAGYAAVRVSGAQGQRLAVAYAQANNDNNSADTIGLVTETIATNQEGFIMTVGQLLDIDTTGSLQGETWADGDVLYLSPTTAGALTNIKPTGATGHIVVMGYVEYAHAVHGSIYVKVMNGWELDELHNVYISSVANNQGLFYESSTQLWKNKSIATVLGYTPANAATTITINGTTYDISTNRTWSVGTVTSIGTSGPITGGTITGSGTIGITQATTSTDGYLSSTDWNTFYNKQAAGSYITALTGEATASGPGSATVTLSTSAVTGKLLTGLNLTGGGSIAATDSILQAFGKVQNQISGLAGGVTYQGTWNASTNTPTLTSSVGTKGYYYIVDVAGSTNLNGITDWKVGDWAIFNGSTWDKVDNTDAVSSVNGFTGAVSLTTSNIAEGTNLYYLDSRARLALSFTAGSGGYNNTTGVITIPTNTSQLTNGANFITLSSLSASSPLAYNSGTGAFSIQVATGAQNGYLSSTDWTTFNGKQNALTLTTTGSSGSATLVGATLNIPTYTLSGLGGVPTSRQLTINGTAYDLSADRSWSVGTHTGSLTSGYIPKATGSTTLTDGLLYDTGSAVLLGTQTAGSGKFMVYSSTADNHYQAIGTAPSFRFADTITSPTYTGIVGLATASNHFLIGAVAGDMVLANNTSSVGNFLFGTGATERMRINATTGNVSIGNTGNTYKLEVTGTTKISGQLTLGSTITNGTYTYTLPSATGTIALVGGSGVGTVTSIATTGPITGGTITSTGTIGITQSGAASDGYLSSTDWNTFNNKQSALTNPVTGTGTTNYLPKFTGTSTIGNSLVYDNGTNVGINTTTFTYASSGRTNLAINGSSSALFELKIGDVASAYLFASAGSVELNAVGARPIYLSNNGAIRATLDASGNLGLGVTPSAASLPTIDTDYGLFVGRAENNITSNAYYNSGWKYSGTGYAARYSANSYVGQHAWYTAPSGTAGNAISFTQAMTLNASGNLSIGNTNDTYKLDVNGTGRFTGSVTAASGTFSQSSGITTIIQSDWDRSATNNTQLYIRGNTNTNKQLRIGYDTAGNVGYIQALTSGTGVDNLLINPSGGSVGIGTTSPSSPLAIKGSANNTVVEFGNASTSNGYMLFFDRTASAYASGYVDALDFSVRTSNTERMRINTNGNVGIGTTNSSYPLNVYKAGANVFSTVYNVAAFNDGTASYKGINLGYLSGEQTGVIYAETNSAASNLAFWTYSGSAWGERMRITSGGEVLVNATSTTQSAKFYVNGTAAFGSVYVGALGTGTVYSNAGFLTNTNPSDRRLKTNIIPLTYGLSDILKLNPVSYNWKDGTNGKQFGFIAQEVQEIMPDAVKPGEYLGLEKDAIYSALINAIKELKEELDLIKNK